jgi:predicted acyl esterase
MNDRSRRTSAQQHATTQSLQPERDHNVVHWTEFSRCGHFAAIEVPDLLVGGVRDFFRQFRS